MVEEVEEDLEVERHHDRPDLYLFLCHRVLQQRQQQLLQLWL
jgi:hypothetical protein